MSEEEEEDDEDEDEDEDDDDDDEDEAAAAADVSAFFRTASIYVFHFVSASLTNGCSSTIFLAVHLFAGSFSRQTFNKSEKSGEILLLSSAGNSGDGSSLIDLTIPKKPPRVSYGLEPTTK